MEWINQLKQKYVKLPKDHVYVDNEDIDKLKQGKNVLAYLDITGRSHSDYTLTSSFNFQPAIEIDDNTYDVVFILI